MRGWIKILTLYFPLLFFLYNKTTATHIVGGSLTYVYNGGNNYTITCKLYRDCTPGTWPMPNSLLINVRGLNGATFTPTRDISLPRISITPVPPSLDSCAIRPNPEPCVEEGLFRITVNLPPSPGGYHLYTNILARNLTLTNINSSGNNIGETFYCFIPPPTTLWLENFNLPNGTTVDNGPTAWSIQNGSIAPSSAAVNGNTFQATGSNNGSVWWISDPINISAYPTGIQLGLDLFENGTLAATDSIKAFYSVDGGPLIPFTFNGSIADDFTTATAFTNGVSGNTVRIYVKMVFAAGSTNSKVYGIDNVGVYHMATPNSNPVFNKFPPLYLCVGQRFEFDHSATDIDGDSLVYSFYTPFNGYNASGNVVSPTYVNNYANFTPVVFLPGYGTNNPLGGNALSLNATTGLLSGVPTILGQFVVGIKVTEYRNGVMLSETYRDFQFNVINCPATRKAVLTEFRTCVGLKVNFTSATDTTQTTYWWNFGDPTTTADTSIKYRPSYTYPSIGTYTVTLVVNKGTVCEDSTTAPVYVGWTNALFSKTNEQCVGYPITFTDLSTFSANSTGATYSWNFGNGATSLQQNPSYVYNTPGTYNVTLTVTSTIGCTSSYSTAVTVGPAPVVNAGPDVTVCSSSPTVTLNGSVTNATGGVWSTTGTGTFSSTTNLTNVTYTPSAADIANGQVKIILTSVSNSVCVISDTVLVSIVTSPTSANAGTDQIICGTSTAILNANAPSVGVGTWSTSSGATIVNPSSPTTQVTGLMPGNTYQFTWTITNGAACSSRGIVQIQADELPTTAQAGPDQILCDVTTTNLSANVPIVGNGTWSIVNGSASITQPNNPNTTITNLIKGDTVVIRWTIAQGVCKNFDDIKIIVNKLPIVNAGQEQNLCNQNPVVNLNGTVTIATGGVWSGGGGTFIPNHQTLNAQYYPTTAEINSGSVTLTLSSTGNGACAAVSGNVKINFKPFHGILNINTDAVNCFGEQNGSAMVSVTGGTGSYQYTWNTVPPQYTATANNLSSGTYTVTVKDYLGCVSTTSATVNEPAVLNASVNTNAVLCFGDNSGSASVIPIGGNGGYTYSWWPVTGSGQTLNNIPAGNYGVEVTDSKGCKTQKNITVIQPPAIQVTGNKTNVLCNGGNNGQITINASGGVLPYSYSWSTPNGNGTTATNLTAGNYTVVVNDANGCTYTYTETISEPALLSATINKTDLSCFNNNSGSATVNVLGGVAPYSYSWSPGISSTSNVANNLSAGNYSVFIKDANNCSWSLSFSLSEPPDLTVQVGMQKNVSCFGGNNASLNISVTGGTGAYSYSWTPSVSSSNSASNLSAGNYSVLVSDQNGCNKTINAIITQPTELLFSGTHTSPSCFGYSDGSIQTTATGGTPPYTYSWNVPGIGNNASFNALPAGNYTITVRDTNNCSKNISFTLTEPSKIMLTTTSNSSTCGLANGSGQVSASGGSGGYTYTWTDLNQYGNSISNVPAGFYSVLVYDNTGCFDSTFLLINDIAGPTISINTVNNVSCYGGNDGTATVSVIAGTPPYTYTWSTNPNQNSPTAINLTAGIYAVSVTDSNGCSTSAITTPPIQEPDSISYTYQIEHIACYGASTGQITVNPAGGTPPYTVSWTTPLVVGNTITNLSQGLYSFTIEDSKNCSYTGQLGVIQAPDIVLSLLNTEDVTCLNAQNGSAQIGVSGGTPPYAYSWSGSSSTAQIGYNLPPGLNWVYVTDINGCRDSISLTINQPSDSVDATISTTAALCFNTNTGSATAIATGGNGGYTYTWLPVNQNGSSVNNLSAGNYSVIVNDSKGCSIIKSFSISQPDKLEAMLSVTPSTCSFSNGSIVAAGIGGNGGYQYSWTPVNNTSNSLNNVSEGIYYLFLTDAQGCQYKDTVLLQNIPGPQIIGHSINNVTCFGLSNGSIQIQSQAVSPPLIYSWIPAVSVDSVGQNLQAGSYWIFVKDVNGCKDSINLNVTQPPKLLIDTIPHTDVNCKDANDGTAMAMVSGGTPAYSYSWSFTNNNSNFVQNIPPGNHSVLVTDANNCTTQTGFFINEPQKLIVNPSLVINATCSGYSDGSIGLDVTGGNFPYTYSWSHSTGLNASYVEGLSAGNYFVMVTDSKGCFDTLSITVEEPSSVVVVIANKPTICLGQTANLIAVASGGNGAPYTYEWQPIPGNGNTLNVSPTQTENYYVVAYDKKGCLSNVDVATVTVYSLFAGDIEIVLKNPICKGTSTTIQAVSNGTNTGPLTYTWNNGLGTGPGPFTITPPAPTVYQVTVATKCGTKVIVRDTLKFIPPPMPGFRSDTISGCYPLRVSFVDTTIQNLNDPVISWNWNFGNGVTSNEQNPTYIYQNPGTFYVTLNVKTLEGCNVVSSPTQFKVIVHHHPKAQFTPIPNLVFTPYGKVQFNNQSIGAITYSWDFGDGETGIVPSPLHVYNDVGTYTPMLIAINDKGCKDTAYGEVKVSGDFIMPNAFTPNPDGPGATFDPSSLDNDVFMAYMKGVKEFRMHIFNRWGELIFESTDPKVGWDGYYRDKLCQAGVYIWQVYIKFIDDREFKKVGDVNLIR